jgi:uncharacterized tellurite resistance protein B-like protein
MFELTPEQSLLALRALATCARADGTITDSEANLIAVSAAMLRIPIADPHALPSVTAAELRPAFASTKEREIIVQAMILTALVDGDVTGAEATLAAEFAKTLEVSERRVHNLRQLSERRLRALWLDLARRSFALPVFEKTLREKGVLGVLRIVAPLVGMGSSTALAQKYIRLGEHAAFTLGHSYFRFIVDNNLGFPGEGIVAEEGLWHDLTHVLSGYGVTPEGEVSVVSFIAGYVREDPFFWLFTIALQFHLGIRVSPYSKGEYGYFTPEIVLAALERGMAVHCDLSRDWDPWPHMHRPLEDVRRDLGIV